MVIDTQFGDFSRFSHEKTKRNSELQGDHPAIRRFFEISHENSFDEVNCRSADRQFGDFLRFSHENRDNVRDTKTLHASSERRVRPWHLAAMGHAAATWMDARAAPGLGALRRWAAQPGRDGGGDGGFLGASWRVGSGVVGDHG